MPFTVANDYYDTTDPNATGDPTVGDPTVGNPDITDRQDSPSLPDYPPSGLPDPGLADYTTGQSDTTKKQMMDAALATASSAGQPNPGDIVAANGNGPTNSQDAMLKAAQAHSADLISGNAFGGAPTPPPASPSLPDYTPPSATGGTAPTGNTGSTGNPTGSHQLSDADWQAAFTQKEGYYNPEFNSREAMLYNAQRGDLVIRPQLEDMAHAGDSDAQRILDAIHATPGFDNGPQSAEWRSLHNTEVTLKEKALLAGTQSQGDESATGQPGFNGKLGANPRGQSQYGSNQAAIANLEAQRVKEIVPGTLEATLPAAAALRDTLIKDGAQNVQYDPTTNKLHWTGTDGLNRALGGMNQAGLLEWADAAAKLKDAASQAAAAAAAQQPQGGYPGGGYPPRSNGYTPPRSNGYTPPAAAPPHTAAPPAQGPTWNNPGYAASGGYTATPGGTYTPNFVPTQAPGGGAIRPY